MATHIIFEGDLTPDEVELIAYLIYKRKKLRPITDDDIIDLAIDLNLSVSSIIKIMRQK